LNQALRWIAEIEHVNGASGGNIGRCLPMPNGLIVCFLTQRSPGRPGGAETIQAIGMIENPTLMQVTLIVRRLGRIRHGMNRHLG
jgi:hypothetical protein